MRKNRRAALVLTAPVLMGLALSPTIGCVADGAQGIDENVATHGMSFEEFKATVYQEPESGVYIVNGDEPIDSERKLKAFWANHIQSDALIVHRVGNADAAWSASAKLNITYCVSKTSFGNQYNTVVSAMTAATGAWEAAANVNFIHDTTQDGSCTASNSKVVFDVRKVNSGGQYLARAFFPDQSRSTRNVLIDTTAFGNIPPWTLTGILRHELGHTLGFRHEHTRPEAGGACFEDNAWRNLTSYDSNSVMHYPQCNGTQQGDLVLTNLDKQGAAALYGAPGGGQPQPEPEPEPTNCAHPLCTASGPLTASCDPCADEVCYYDSYCCSTAWDGQCVNEAKSWCGLTCN